MDASPRPKEESKVRHFHSRTENRTWSENCREVFTLKEGSDVPRRDSSLLHELAQCDLQEEDRDSSDEHDQQVRDQENSWRKNAQIQQPVPLLELLLNLSPSPFCLKIKVTVYII